MISIKPYLKTKQLSTGKYPIYLRLTHNRKSILYRTPYSAYKNEWDGKQGKFTSKSGDYLEKNKLLLKLQERITSIITKLEQEKGYSTIEEIDRKLKLQANSGNKNLLMFMLEIIDEQKVSGRTGNARVNADTLTSLKKYCGKKELVFTMITPEFLEKYEVWLRSNGGTDGGIGVKMRCIRAVFNTAIKRGQITGNLYPFNLYKVSKLKSTGIKKALNLSDIHKIEKIDLTQYPTLIDTRNQFIFSFYTRGMNFADMMTLKWQDISNDRIYYKRAKTKRNFQIKILPPAKKILNFYRKKKSETGYVFPILLEENMTPSHLENRKKKTLKRYNRRLKELGEVCKIKQPLTSYVARHSYANCLKQKGVATDIISESMGHQNIAITQAYLKELDNSLVDDAMEVLLFNYS
ncbi:site-specific integrase [Carboxylicivirga sp. M1479]|uniref:site-specific integrase n=1 Tax=Carboxylicivirga sp. M1479 TaxID=2594476 RepID=UPI00163D7134|nr:site-specific integrase [Carboxylicivirga sp. M1479]